MSTMEAWVTPRAVGAPSAPSPAVGTSPVSAPRGRALWRLIGLAAALAPAAWVMRTADFAQAGRLLATAGPVLLIVLLPFPLSMAVETVAWRQILRALGTRPPFVPLYGARLAAEAVVYSMPGGSVVSEGTKPVLLKKWCGVHLPEALASLGAKRFLLLLSHALYLALGALLARETLRRLSPKLVGGPGLEWIGLVAAVAIFAAAMSMALVFVRGAPAATVGRVLARAPIGGLRRRAKAAATRLSSADGRLRSLFRAPQRWLPASGALFVAGWAWETVETLLVLHCLGIPIGVAEVLAAETLLTLARSLSLFAPAGLGLQDAGYTLFFAALGIPDPATVGLSFSIVKRTKEVVWIMVGYGLIVRWWPRGDGA